MFDYQSVRHCSKTQPTRSSTPTVFDYQSVRHCSKTELDSLSVRYRVWLPVSSTLLQNEYPGTQPSCKFDYQSVRHCSKTDMMLDLFKRGLITSQFDTAPKRARRAVPPVRVWLPVSSTLLQNSEYGRVTRVMFDYQSVRHCSKTKDV